MNVPVNNIIMEFSIIYEAWSCRISHHTQIAQFWKGMAQIVSKGTKITYDVEIHP